MAKVVDANDLMAWIITNQRDESTVVPPPVGFVCPTCGLSFTSQTSLANHIAVVHAPPVGVPGSKMNPYKLTIPYAAVLNGYICERGKEFTIGNGQLIYLEVDPVFLKPGASAFQMVIKGMNCPNLYIYKAYYDKNSRTYTDDIFFTLGGCIDRIPDGRPRELDDFRFLYGIKNESGESWAIQHWVQMA